LPFLSIIVPTLNRLDTLAPCLESIERSTHVRHEVIVCANECNEETAAFLDDRPQLRSIRTAHNRFFTAAVNDAIGMARGEYVFLMNDDCHVAELEWVDFYVSLLEVDPRIGVVGPHWKNIDELPWGWIEPYAAMYRRSIFDELGPLPHFDESFCLWWSDIYHAYRLMKHGYYLLPLERSLADSVVAHARPAGGHGETVLRMRETLPADCFEFHGKELMYERLGITDEACLAGYFGSRVWTREEVGSLLDGRDLVPAIR
jgi:GT2 family glycosyltransferase